MVLSTHCINSVMRRSTRSADRRTPDAGWVRPSRRSPKARSRPWDVAPGNSGHRRGGLHETIEHPLDGVEEASRTHMVKASFTKRVTTSYTLARNSLGSP